MEPATPLPAALRTALRLPPAVQPPVNLAEDGRIAEREPGVVRCAGMIGRQTVDPALAVASVAGRARRRGRAASRR